MLRVFRQVVVLSFIGNKRELFGTVKVSLKKEEEVKNIF